MTSDKIRLTAKSACLFASPFTITLLMFNVCIPPQVAAEEVFNFKRCILGTNGEVVSAVPVSKVEACAEQAINVCLQHQNYQLCLHKLSNSSISTGKERGRMFLGLEKREISVLPTFQEVQQYLKKCNVFYGENKAQCEAIIAIAYNIELSSQSSLTEE